MDDELKPLDWVGSSRKDLRALPDAVQSEFGHALYFAQRGERLQNAKPLQGFGGAGVLEIVESYRGDAYRAVYTVRFADVIYVLHCFQKKSTSGIKTSKQDVDLIKSRLSEAERMYKARK